MTSQKNNRILIVDDEPLNRMFLVDLLKMYELIPTEATNGNEALQQWQENDYAVILMDIQMPYLNGLEATRLIRQQEKEQGLAKTPIIAVTAYGTTETMNDCREAGMDGFIPKPIKISDLLEMIGKFH